MYDGKLSASAVDESALRQNLRNKKQFVVYLRQNPIRFKKVAVKRFRIFLFLNEEGARVRICLYKLRIWLIHSVASSRQIHARYVYGQNSNILTSYPCWGLHSSIIYLH